MKRALSLVGGLIVSLVVFVLVGRSVLAPSKNAVPPAASQPSSSPSSVSQPPMSLHPFLMGTQCNLTVVPGSANESQATDALAAGFDAMKQVDEAMSLYKPASELSRLNAAKPGEAVKLSDLTANLLRISAKYTGETDGAFDPTARALFKLWGAAGKANRLPTAEEIAAAQSHKGWDKLRLEGNSAARLDGAMQIDLNAIACGYAADLAAEAMKKAGMIGGMADGGGEIRVFGKPANGDAWRIGIQDPFRPDGTLCGVLAIREGAVSTSGSYEKYETVAGRHHSHIVDPRTGQTADRIPSVTVVMADATAADMWSTALSVLGPDGLKMIEKIPGAQAMLIVGTPEKYTILTTPGFDKLLVDGIHLEPAAGTMPTTAETPPAP